MTHPGAGVMHSAAPELPDVSDLDYERAREELAEIVSTLEGGQAGLAESMQLWARGEALAAHCQRWLDRAEAAVAAQVAPVDQDERAARAESSGQERA